MIPVTRPVLPPLDEFVEKLRIIWSSLQLTNDGAMVRELEASIAKVLGVRHVIFVSNGTIAIQFAVRAVGMKGRVATTPFSYVATTSALVWEGLEPAFADIEPGSLTICPSQTEALLKKGANGVLATHVYGNPCDIDALCTLGERYNVPIVYDAAHAFGARYKGRSLCAYGSAATLSFHATKLFHTVEGGAVVTEDDAVADAVRRLRNFGQSGVDHIDGLGINGKNSEVHAAMGLCLLPRLSDIIRERTMLAEVYSAEIADCDADVKPISWRDGTIPNYSYYPVVFSSEAALDRCMQVLAASDIRARRYFRPSLSHLPYIRNPNPTPVADSVVNRVLCLPLYSGLDPALAQQIAVLVRSSLTVAL